MAPDDDAMNEPKDDATRPAASAWHDAFDALANASGYRGLRSACGRVAALEGEFGPPPGSVPLRLALLGGATLDLLVEPLRATLLSRGIAPDIFVGAFGQYVREMIDPEAGLDEHEPQVVVVLNTPFNVGSWPDASASLEEVEESAEAACEELLGPCRALHDRVGCAIVLNTLHDPSSRSLGNIGAKLPGDPVSFTRRVNLRLAERAPAFVHLNDVAALAARHGTDRWLDLRYWFQAKQPVAFELVAEYARNTAALVAAVLGRRRKVIVLDLDNTLWGGVVGDDGIEGIELGEGSPAGEAYKAFQEFLRSLKAIGIVLAVCSKNEQHIAEEAFEKHPEMVLDREDFVSFQANWEPKSDNIRAIARELDLGLDAFVFVDDNPAEREQVRLALPEVAVPDIGDEPAEFPRRIMEGRYFEAVAITDEDRTRTEQYRARRSAEASREHASDLSIYLQGLEMRAVIRPFEPVSMERITQLTNKTNQFNLTTLRVTRSEMERYAADPHYLTRTLRLRDRFGDHGLVGVLWARTYRRRMRICNWLMSCRVLKRGAEHAMFNSVLEAASERGVETIEGEYLPTERNTLVAGLYEELGFRRVADLEGGGTRFELDVASAAPLSTFIGLESHSATP